MIGRPEVETVNTIHCPVSAHARASAGGNRVATTECVSNCAMSIKLFDTDGSYKRVCGIAAMTAAIAGGVVMGVDA